MEKTNIFYSDIGGAEYLHWEELKVEPDFRCTSSKRLKQDEFEIKAKIFHRGNSSS